MEKRYIPYCRKGRGRSRARVRGDLTLFFCFPRGPRGRRIRGKGYVGEGEVGLELT